ncbi:MAG TPA: succinate dehydrogenase, cytochrome b556 subunit [Methylotenera sp.]|nr:succinate dehydrogenase, cytochrome b556 subunit [Methylotenera sp.]HPV45431.1 succinate dehydrogenase, cytochrome b556 subunit [Methylotenera sp.]
MQKKTARSRPKNLNLFTIRLPINAVVSILHRVSGMVLFLMLPLILLAFQRSVKSQDSYTALAELLNVWFIKLMLIGLAWSFSHHFFAGIRHLMQDIHWMTSLQKARFSGRVVLWLVGFSVAIFAFVVW